MIKKEAKTISKKYDIILVFGSCISPVFMIVISTKIAFPF